MKRLLLFAALAGLGLVSASPPEGDHGRGPGAEDGAYPPCSRTVRDRCIQRERGDRPHREAGHHRRHHAHDGDGRHEEHARHEGHRRHDGAMGHRGGSAHARRASRCAARCPAPRRVVAARVRRAGERG